MDIIRKMVGVPSGILRSKRCGLTLKKCAETAVREERNFAGRAIPFRFCEDIGVQCEVSSAVAEQHIQDVARQTEYMRRTKRLARLRRPSRRDWSFTGACSCRARDARSGP